jgi:predicted Ser/Thr protein kinase
MLACPACGEAVDAPRAFEAADDESVRRQVQRALGEQYRILSTLGRGGMGVVYLARQAGLERLVAVKVLAPDIGSRESHERFRREARMAAALNHPAILPVYAFGDAGDMPYIVMGYVRSETLADLLRHEMRLPVDRARRILCELAGALDYAHRHGVIHRDIKPENILLEDESERALLMDFGIAKSAHATGTITASGVAVGTPMYMSPEQVMGAGVDARSDLYSLGLVGYEMLAGRTPFVGPYERLLADDKRHVPPLREVAPDVPDDLSNAIMRCIARQPDDRWPDARSLGLAIEAGNAEAGVPDELRAMSGFGAWTALWFAAWGTIAVRAWFAGSGSLMLILSALLVPVGFALQAWHLHRGGFSLRQIAYVSFWPPKWWGLWWPRGLRRPDDMWHALPRSARFGRAMLTLFFVVTPALVYVERLVGFSPTTAAWQAALRSAEYGIIVLTAVAIGALAMRWSGRGLDVDQLARWLVGSTTSGSFWRAPQVSPLLDDPKREETKGPTTPHDYLRAISEAAATLQGSARAAGSDAVAAARTLMAAIDACDAELRVLRRDADPLEASRIQERLALLGETGDEGVTYDDQAQMRQLLRHQLELFARLGVRQEMVAARRRQLADRMSSLWHALRQLAREGVGVPTGERATDREALRALCLSIENGSVSPTTQKGASPEAAAPSSTPT